MNRLRFRAACKHEHCDRFITGRETASGIAILYFGHDVRYPRTRQSALQDKYPK